MSAHSPVPLGRIEGEVDTVVLLLGQLGATGGRESRRADPGERPTGRHRASSIGIVEVLGVTAGLSNDTLSVNEIIVTTDIMSIKSGVILPLCQRSCRLRRVVA